MRKRIIGDFTVPSFQDFLKKAGLEDFPEEVALNAAFAALAANAPPSVIDCDKLLREAVLDAEGKAA